MNDPDENPFWGEPTPTDLWADMAKLNALYEELMWPNDVELEFKADYEHNRIIISVRGE